MSFIFINPVTLNMYDQNSLKSFLKSKEFIPVECKSDWISKVLEKYKAALSKTENTLVDMRCPKAVTYVKSEFPALPLAYPDIEPILIHCAREISEEYGSSGEIIITTPCASLAEYGNSLLLKNTTFISWNQFSKNIGCTLKKSHLSASPIPQGFFDGLKVKTKSVTEKSNIHQFFCKGNSADYKLVELLYCENGCNNGDGVL